MCLCWENGKRWIEKHEVYNCNWLQPMENSVDPSHLYWLHGDTAHLVGVVDHYEEDHNFIPFEYGIMKRRRHPGKEARRCAASARSTSAAVSDHPAPCVSRALKTAGLLRHNLQIRVPVDDAHTQVFVVYFSPNDTDHSPADGDTPWEYFPIRDEKGEYRLEHVLVQDAMAWETQGAPTDRTQEHLGVGDEGIILLRKLLRDQIEIVKKGGEPLGVVRDPGKNRLIEFDVINERIGIIRQAAEGGVKSTGTEESLSSHYGASIIVRPFDILGISYAEESRAMRRDPFTPFRITPGSLKYLY